MHVENTFSKKRDCERSFFISCQRKNVVDDTYSYHPSGPGCAHHICTKLAGSSLHLHALLIGRIEHTMGHLQKLYKGWLVIAHRIGAFQSRLMLTLFYLIILSPYGFWARASDWLKVGGIGHWMDIEKPDIDRSDLSKQ